MSRDDLRAMLEKIAATAGDPPEHGLDGVAARRRRRTRHRRGAVATAMALAVLGIAIYPRLGWLGEGDTDVTAAETGGRRRPTELPNVVELHCAPDGIDVPVASIRPQRDGLHLLVRNTRSTATDVSIVARNWQSGPIRVEPGRTRRLTQPVAPGPLTVSCEIDGEAQRRRVELVDVDEIYEEPELACDDEEPTALEPVDITATSTVVTATTQALDRLELGTDVEVQHYSGYPAPRYSEHTTEPTVEVLDAGQLVAFAYLASDEPESERAPQPPWTQVTFEGCPGFLTGVEPGGGGGTTQPPP